MAPPKGKQGTKGQKQIVEENKEALKFYAIMAITSEVVYLLVMLTLYYDAFTPFYMVLTVLTVAIHAGSLQFMKYMAKAVYSETGQLLDGGIDLNMKSGISEHLKDMIILTSLVQLFSILSNYFWFFLLLAPGQAFYLLWTSILAPWIFQPAPEVDDKKQKKMERRSKRH